MHPLLVGRLPIDETWVSAGDKNFNGVDGRLAQMFDRFLPTNDVFDTFEGRFVTSSVM